GAEALKRDTGGQRESGRRAPVARVSGWPPPEAIDPRTTTESPMRERTRRGRSIPERARQASTPWSRAVPTSRATDDPGWCLTGTADAVAAPYLDSSCPWRRDFG